MSTQEIEPEEMFCFCGAKMRFAGFGAYPYDCCEKDHFPEAPVWKGCADGHTGWTTNNGKPLQIPRRRKQ